VEFPQVEQAIDEVIAKLAQAPVPAEDLERTKTQMIAQAVYAQDSQTTLARWYGAAITVGLSVDDVRAGRIGSRRHRRTGPRGCAEMARQEAVRHRLPDQGARSGNREARGEAFVIVTRRQLPSIAAALLAAATSLATFATPAAAAKVQRVVSPGGIEAWFVQDATVPLVAMEYAFAGGSSQDPAGKPGTGSFTANMLDEGAADLDSKTFHERLERRAIEMSFSVTRDYLRGSMRMLKEHSDEAFGLLKLALTSPGSTANRWNASARRCCRMRGAKAPIRFRSRAANSGNRPTARILTHAHRTARLKVFPRFRPPI
jgi:hypothetical protein